MTRHELEQLAEKYYKKDGWNQINLLLIGNKKPSLYWGGFFLYAGVPYLHVY